MIERKSYLSFYSFFLLASYSLFNFSLADTSVIAGVDKERLKRLDEKIAEHVEQEQYPGFSGLIVRNGEIVHKTVTGWQDRERKIKLREDTIFRVYSMSKAITSIGAMLLFEEGKFQIDDPVDTYIPAFKELRVYTGGEKAKIETEELTRPITFRDLFTHTSGLTYHFIGDTPIHHAYRKKGITPGVSFLHPSSIDGESIQSLAAMVEALTQIPLLHQPGERMSYGVSIDVLGRLIEIISGQRLDEFLNEKLFIPLKMSDTGFSVPKNKLHRFANNYLWRAQKLELLDDARKSRYQETDRILSGGAGMVSTLHDYMQFLQMLMNGGELNGARLLSPVTVDFILSNHFLKKDIPRPEWMEQQGHSLGFALTLDPVEMGMLSSIGTADWAGAASTFFWLDRKQHLAAVFMTQRAPLNSNAFMRTIKNLTYQSIVR